MVFGVQSAFMACRGSGVRVSLAPFFKKVSPAMSGPHGPLFLCKTAKYHFLRAPNSGVRALSGASAENALCIRLNDRGVGAAPMKEL